MTSQCVTCGVTWTADECGMQCPTCRQETNAWTGLLCRRFQDRSRAPTWTPQDDLAFTAAYRWFEAEGGFDGVRKARA